MLFNSLDFAIFLPIVFLLYWWVFKNNLKRQNFFLLVVSYIFYGWWDYRFLGLIFFSTLVDYFLGIYLQKEKKQSKRKILLWTSILVNLGFLGFFKYFNFFIDNFVTAFSFFGKEIGFSSLNIILPIGISFYTFQTLSYTIDVYRNKLTPTKDFIAFGAFVSFFPQLVAGPIERASNLLPQFYEKRIKTNSKIADGLRQILWGLFKKVVIADNCAEIANQIFNNSQDYSGSTLFLGAFFFTFQIYGDFSGYSDIAIGTAKLFGFKLKKNFALPYFSRDIAEFWRRWHISLSTWFRDYLYIPLGGSKGTTFKKLRNIFIIFLVSGFWHGANWTFVFWGFLNALYFLPLMLLKLNRKNMDVVAEKSIFPSIRNLFSILITFCLTIFAWIFFRAENLTHGFQIVSEIFSSSFFSSPEFTSKFLYLILFLVVIEWFNKDKEYPLEYTVTKSNVKRVLDYVLISILIWAIIIWNSNKEVEFIYFQF
ncbi:MAG: MBOAT family protein [Flavobacteriaceae bacterium]